MRRIITQRLGSRPLIHGRLIIALALAPQTPAVALQGEPIDHPRIIAT
jgi:hypothetical protein